MWYKKYPTILHNVVCNDWQEIAQLHHAKRSTKTVIYHNLRMFQFYISVEYISENMQWKCIWAVSIYM